MGSRHWKSHFGKFGPISLGRLDVLVERNIACQAMEFLTAPWKRSSAKFSKIQHPKRFLKSAPNFVRFHPGFLTSQDSYKLWGFLLLGSVTIARTLWAVECCPACFQVCFLLCGPACGLKRMSLSLFPMVVWSVRERCVHKLINKKLPASFCILFWCLKK